MDTSLDKLLGNEAANDAPPAFTLIRPSERADMPTTGQLAESVGLEPLVANLLETVGAPGATVALSIDGDLWSTAIGHSDLERREPLISEARFSIYSITKTVIATLILRLVEGRESFALDDSLQSLLPRFPISTPISIRQILNHTAGLPSYGTTPDYHQAIRDSPGTPWTAGEFLSRTLGTELLFMPGHGWRYSNIGYLLLRQLLEQEAGITFPQIVRQYLANPFGLHSLSGAAILADVQSLTPGYSSALSDDGEVENVIPRYHPGWVSHGLVTAIAGDLAQFVDLLFRGKMLEPPLHEAMLIGAPVAETHRWMSKPAYGLGLMMDPEHRFGIVAGHTGGGPGYSTAAYHFPNLHGHHLTAVALVNRDSSDIATDIVFSIADCLAEHISPGPPG